jgi:hypothetical protein
VAAQAALGAHDRAMETTPTPNDRVRLLREAGAALQAFAARPSIAAFARYRVTAAAYDAVHPSTLTTRRRKP